MIRVENIDVWGFEHAIRGMRNPKNSWHKSDSEYDVQYYDDDGNETDYYDVELGKNDLDLMRRLYKAGTEHRKYLRQIFVSMDIVAPLYWWKEFDTYKVGTVANSCSTMHKIAAKEIELSDFSFDDFEFYNEWQDPVMDVIDACEKLRQAYLKTRDKSYWYLLIRLLPESYNQRRTVTMDYENVVTIIKQRSGHKLDEWRDLIEEVLKSLPCIEEIMGESNADQNT